MNSFVFALICLLGWGLADIFYKKSSEGNDKYSHLKIAVWVGLVMGICSCVLLPFSETHMNGEDFFSNIVKYAPASLSYIISMVIGYVGLRYLEISIISPVQNASGAFSAILMVCYFLIFGNQEEVLAMLEPTSVNFLNIVGTVIIVIGIISLAIVEKRISNKEKTLKKEERKYRLGALALIFPLLYCLFDTIGTAADGIILNETTGLGIGEIDVLILYGFTFFVAGVFAYIYIWIRERKPYNPFRLSEVKTKGVAAIFEQLGQIFYVYAMADNPIFVAPMVASYCIVSVILSRIFLKEKLKISQYVCVITVIIGIILLGIAEGLGG